VEIDKTEFDPLYTVYWQLTSDNCVLLYSARNLNRTAAAAAVLLLEERFGLLTLSLRHVLTNLQCDFEKCLIMS
jgi:hypothetical protein